MPFLMGPYYLDKEPNCLGTHCQLAHPGMKAPEFKGLTIGPNAKGPNHMSLKDFTSNGSWCLLFFLPKAKDELSSNEIEGAREELSSLNLIKKDLDDLKCNLLVCTEAKDTTNNLELRTRTISRWVYSAPGGLDWIRGLKFPLLRLYGENAKKYGVLRNDSVSTFLVDSEGIIRMVPRMTIRSDFRMLPETIKALQDALKHAR